MATETTLAIKKKIIAHISDRLNDMVPGTPTVQAYEKFIMGLSDKQFEEWILALENGVLDFPEPNKPVAGINIIVPNGSGHGQLDVGRNLKLAKKMGHEFFEQIWLTNPTTGRTTLSNRRYLCMHLPIRRQAQTLDHKISVSNGDSQVDDLTGQVTGDAKGAAISYPEVQMLESQGLVHTINELTKTRGGDEEAWRMMKRNLIDTGNFSTEILDRMDTRAKVNKAFYNILSGMHIKNNV